MNKQLLLLVSTILVVTAFVTACKKDGDDKNTLLAEEFEDVRSLPGRGWAFINNSTPATIAPWQQGFNGAGKGGPSGFSAFSYKNYSTEFAYTGNYYASPNYSISSWMIAPPLEMKNGDKISFYTRAENISGLADRLQVRLNTEDTTSGVGSTATSVGKFTTVLKDVNEGLAVNGYPQAWTRYEATITGLPAAKQVRIAFRYCPDSGKSGGIGIDLFEVTGQ